MGFDESFVICVDRRDDSRRRPKTMITRITATLTIMALFALSISDCTGPESADEDERAEAVESAPEAEDIDDSVAAAEIFDGREFDVERLAEAVDEAGDERATEALGSMGMIPESELCDGGPCTSCEVGAESRFFVEEAGLAVRSCCDDTDCITQWYFEDDEASLIIVGDGVGPADVSPDGRAVALIRHAVVGEWPGGDSTDEDLAAAEEAVAVVDIDELQRRAQPDAEPTPVLVASQALEFADWTLYADDLRGLEALSARAVQEGQEPCEAGVHLPTLFELAEGADPLSPALMVELLRWVDDSTLLAKSYDSAGTWMLLDVQTECMERFAMSRQPSRISPAVEVEEPMRWELGHAATIGETPSLTMVYGQLYDPEGVWPEHIEVTVFVDGDQVAADSVAVARRYVSGAEIEWSMHTDQSLDVVADPALDVSRAYEDGVAATPVTILVEEDVGEEGEMEVVVHTR